MSSSRDVFDPPFGELLKAVSPMQLALGKLVTEFGAAMNASLVLRGEKRVGDPSHQPVDRADKRKHD
jgi:hypothetical protein